MMCDFAKLASRDNLFLAYKRLQTVERSPYKALSAQDSYNFGYDLENNLQTLSHDLLEGVYVPTVPHKIYIPKANGLVRPITVLDFIDAVVYQAIINLLAETSYDELSPDYNSVVFGNVYNKTADEKRIFFYTRWKEQYRKYEDTTRRYFNEGLRFITQFDLASFYDTVDHFVLTEILKQAQVDKEIVELLMRQLGTWTADADRNNRPVKHGIPQGPNASGFLAEIYLHGIDTKMQKILRGVNAKYIRYVDDIRLFSKDDRLARRLMGSLDLHSRDLGLIPQANKVKIQEATSLNDFLKLRSDFSQIAVEYRKTHKLRSKFDKRLTKQVVQTLQTEDFDKTTLRFALYRISRNDEVRDLLLRHSERLGHLYEEVCFYLAKHYSDCPEVTAWVTEQIEDPEPTYYYTVAMVFKYFGSVIPFNRHVFDRLINEEKHWLTRTYLLEWAAASNPDYLCLVPNCRNTRVRRELMRHRFDLAREKGCIEVLQSLLDQMLTSDATCDALEGRRLADELRYDITSLARMNAFLRGSVQNKPSTYLVEDLRTAGVEKADSLFDPTLWTPEELSGLREKYENAKRVMEIDPSSWLIHMNSFNHMVTRKILSWAGSLRVNGTDYGNLLEVDGVMRDKFPKAYAHFKNMNTTRNERAGHPYDKEGRVSQRFTWSMLTTFLTREIVSLEEIADGVAGWR